MSGTALEMEVVKKFLKGSKDLQFRKWAEGKFASGKLDVASALEHACSSELSAGCDPLQSEKMNDPKSSTMQTEPVSVREVSQMAVPRSDVSSETSIWSDGERSDVGLLSSTIHTSVSYREQ